MNGRIEKTIEKWKQSARKLKSETKALYLAYKHPQTPWYAKAFAGLVIAYAFSPIDLVPDFIPVLGYIDDLILVPLGITLAIKMIPGSVMVDCRMQAEIETAEGKQANWISAVIIIMLWITLAVFFMLWLTNFFK